MYFIAWDGVYGGRAFDNAHLDDARTSVQNLEAFAQYREIPAKVNSVKNAHI